MTSSRRYTDNYNFPSGSHGFSKCKMPGKLLADPNPNCWRSSLVSARAFQKRLCLVGGWTNPVEKYARQIGLFPQVVVKTCSKPQPRFSWNMAKLRWKTQTLPQKLATHQQICLIIPRNRCQKREAFLGPGGKTGGVSHRVTMCAKLEGGDDGGWFTTKGVHPTQVYMGIVTKHMKV